MIEVSKNGMVKTEIALAIGLPIFDFTSGEETGIKIDHCSRSELKILNIILTQYEIENFIVAFLKDKNYRGLMPLYSLQQIRDLRGI